jgi:hypothetical protein
MEIVAAAQNTVHSLNKHLLSVYNALTLFTEMKKQNSKYLSSQCLLSSKVEDK